MFSGIVETTGVIRRIKMNSDCLMLTISPQSIFDDIRIGDSIAVNGTCLTVTGYTDNHFDFTVVPETLRLTNLNQLSVGEQVNLERSMKMSDRIGGHYVQGHIDEMGEIIELHADSAETVLLKIRISEKIGKYIVSKGYIALDGMSITVIEVVNNWFTVTIIPHTRQVSIANQYHVGSKVNIEVDMMGKYAEKLLRNN